MSDRDVGVELFEVGLSGKEAKRAIHDCDEIVDSVLELSDPVHIPRQFSVVRSHSVATQAERECQPFCP